MSDLSDSDPRYLIHWCRTDTFNRGLVSVRVDAVRTLEALLWCVLVAFVAFRLVTWWTA
jgi:hypothetical protein